LLHLITLSDTHTHTRARAVGPPVRGIGPSQSHLPDNTHLLQETAMSPARFEPAIPKSMRPQTYARPLRSSLALMKR